MQKSTNTKRINTAFWGILAMSLIGITVLLTTPHYVVGSIDDSCPAGMVKKGYSFQNGQGTLECMKSGYYALQQHAPQMFLGTVVGLMLGLCVILSRRNRVFRADNIRLGIRQPAKR